MKEVANREEEVVMTNRGKWQKRPTVRKEKTCWSNLGQSVMANRDDQADTANKTTHCEKGVKNANQPTRPHIRFKQQIIRI